MKIKKFAQEYLKNFINSGNLFFIIGVSLYVLINYYFFLNSSGSNFFRDNLNYFHLITSNLVKNFEETGLEVEFKNNTYSINKEEPVFLKNYNPKLGGQENILYISKYATKEDLKGKNSIALLNSKELIISSNSQEIIYPIESIQGFYSKIDINNLKELNNDLTPGSNIFNNIGFNLIMIYNIVEGLFLYVIALFILPILVFGILYLSGYSKTDKKEFVKNSIIVMGVFIGIKTPLFNEISEPSFLSIILILSVIVSVLEKRKLDFKKV